MRVDPKPSDLPIGRIAGLFGIRGELKCDPTSSGRALFMPGVVLTLRGAHGDRAVTIESVREHKGRLLIALAEAEDATQAETFVGGTFYAPKEALDVEDGEYLDVDLVGCTVRDHNGRELGRVERVEHYPSNDMLVIGGKLLPMVRAFIRSVDIRAKEIVVDDLPAGLLEGESL
jgi:16S rRNA processing protein RimM